MSTAVCWSGDPLSPENMNHQKKPPPPGYPVYHPTNLVRLMVVAKQDGGPFLTAVVTTQGDKLVVSNIANGDPPAAFNHSAEYGFRAQNGKYIFFDYPNYTVRLDKEPHNETQYMPDGTIMTANPPSVALDPVVNLCPQGDGTYTFSYYGFCNGQFMVDIYPIPPQSLTALWENRTRYDSPKQKGWLDSRDLNNTDNSTFEYVTKKSGGVKVEWSWTVLSTLFGYLM